MNTEWKWYHTGGIVFFAVAILLGGFFLPRVIIWICTIISLAVSIGIAGHGITGRFFGGWLIDDRNMMSLSRLQMVLWTIIIISGYLAAALSNIASRQAEPLSIAIPSELWLAMGISTTSLIGTPLIRSTKEDKEPDDTQRAATFTRRGDNASAPKILGHRGLIVTNRSLSTANFGDLFRGEETGNAAVLDLAKIQMFYFTVILVLAYAVSLGAVLASTEAKISAFPAFDAGMVALLGISNAGYLANKAVPHSTVM